MNLNKMSSNKGSRAYKTGCARHSMHAFFKSKIHHGQSPSLDLAASGA